MKNVLLCVFPTSVAPEADGSAGLGHEKMGYLVSGLHIYIPGWWWLMMMVYDDGQWWWLMMVNKNLVSGWPTHLKNMSEKMVHFYGYDMVNDG